MTLQRPPFYWQSDSFSSFEHLLITTTSAISPWLQYFEGYGNQSSQLNKKLQLKPLLEIKTYNCKYHQAGICMDVFITSIQPPPPPPKTIWDFDIMLFLFRNRIHICYKVYKVTQFVPCVNVYLYYGNMFLSIMLSLLSKVCIYNWLRHLVDNNNIMDTVCFTQMYKKTVYRHNLASYILSFFFLNILLAVDLCRFCVVIRFSSPPQQPMTSDFEGFSIPEFIHYIYFPILILEKEPVFSLLNVEC